MNTQEAYNSWAIQYDTTENKTRDLEGKALRLTLARLNFKNCLEIGCGTGKNTEWLLTKAAQVTAVDLSEGMLAKAAEKVTDSRVKFIQADITEDWTFSKGHYDLVGFSLVLEHINDLEPVLQRAANSLHTGGYVYIGELHPFKQYSGSKARFDTAAGIQVVPCFNHHISDFLQAAEKAGLVLMRMNEYFDDDNRNIVPRILTLLLQKA